MFIQPERRRSDPRIMFGILARATLNRVNKQYDEPVRLREVYFDNLIRLLEMYRYDALREHNQQGILVRQDVSSAMNVLDRNEAGLEALEHLFNKAHKQCYPHLDKEGLVLHVGTILEKIKHGGSGAIAADDLKGIQGFIALLQQP